MRALRLLFLISLLQAALATLAATPATPAASGTHPSGGQSGAPLVASHTRIARGPWSGAVTANSATIKAKLDHDGRVARLLVSEAPDFSRPRYFGPQTSDTNSANVVTFPVTGLRPDTRYHYVLEVKGEIEPAKSGQFRTFPARPASFRFAFASCGRTGSTNASYEMIRRHEPLFFLCDGDFHYEDIRTNQVSRFWHAYDKVLASPVQSHLYREVPLVYVWDDHDFCGNDSDDRALGRAEARQAYEDYIPHYPLFDSSPHGSIQQSFDVGRVHFIVTDLRSQRDPSGAVDSPRKTMLGPEQKAWLKRELLSANGRYPLIFWVTSVPWAGSTQTNHYWPVTEAMSGWFHHTNLSYVVTTNAKPNRPYGDSWAAYATERREIADFIKANRIRGLVLLHGDMHALAADDGTHTDYATGGGAPLPLFAAAPLDQNGSIKGGPYSAGVYKPAKGEGCFGLVEVTDRGREIKARFSGRNSSDEEKVTLTVTFPPARTGR